MSRMADVSPTEQIAGAASQEDLRRMAEKFLGPFGLQSANYHYLPPLGGREGDRVRAYTNTHPQDALAAYLKRGLFRHNPFVMQSVRGATPFTDLDPDLTRDPRARAIYDEMMVVNPHGWIGIPVFGPGGRDGTFLLGCTAENAHMRSVTETGIARLQSICQAVHLRFCALVEVSLHPAPRLTPREMDVLAWVARGKSNADIAGILDISPHGVDKHLRGIYSKLGVFDRLSATLRGIGSGILYSGRV